MTPDTSQDSSEAFEAALAISHQNHYVLRLYVAGLTARSTAAISNTRRICETFLEGRYDLEVIDVYQHPDLAQNEQILAAPTLVKYLPRPLRRLIGDLSNEQKILVGLDIRPRP